MRVRTTTIGWHCVHRYASGCFLNIAQFLLVWSLQYNAPNRIQSSTLANGGSRLRIGSGSNPTLNYKDYYIGGNDTPFCSAQAGPVTMCVDLSDTSHNNEVGTFDLANVSAYGHASVRFNLVGGSTTQTFFQRSFLFTTTKDSANIPKFTGVSSFDDAVALLQGTGYQTKIGSWITKSGSSIFLPCPFQIGDGSSATTFNDNGAAIVSPASNLAGQANVAHGLGKPVPTSIGYHLERVGQGFFGAQV